MAGMSKDPSIIHRAYRLESVALALATSPLSASFYAVNGHRFWASEMYRLAEDLIAEGKRRQEAAPPVDGEPEDTAD
jgi:hypothetical protein